MSIVAKAIWAENCLKNTIGIELWGIKNKKSRQELKKNVAFKNKHINQRCFILGNGPSLDKIDLALLSEEITFTVNQLSRNQAFPLLHTNYHFWADPAFFNIDLSKPEDLELLSVMKSVNTRNNTPTVFFPIEQRNFAVKHKLDQALDLHFFRPGLQMKSSINSIDFARFIPSFSTVVHYCIAAAIYMGFKEIYLLGCDNTSLITIIQAATEQKISEYAYDVSENEQKRMASLLNNHTLYDYTISYANTLRDYTELYMYCERNGIMLRNCTENSAIDSIPHIDFSSVMKKDNSKIISISHIINKSKGFKL